MNRPESIPNRTPPPGTGPVQRKKTGPDSGPEILWLRFAGLCSLASVICGLLLIGSADGAGNDVQAPAKLMPPVVVVMVAEISLQNLQFEPVTITVKRGDVVEWKNNDLVAHTATAALFDSGLIASGESWRYKFTEAGNYPFICSFHPQMKGMIIVK
jgi:plastocyanin